VWKVITKLQNSSEYVGCVDSWIEFVLKCFGHRELNTVLGDVIKVCRNSQTAAAVVAVVEKICSSKIVVIVIVFIVIVLVKLLHFA